MTITFNPLEVLRFICIVSWLGIAGFIAFSSTFFAHDVGDRVFAGVLISLCIGSALTLYMGR
jgi:hypothetical protein